MSTLTLAVSKPFDLPYAVCSYGYFLLAPNEWDAPSRTWRTVVHDDAGPGGRAVRVAVTQPGGRDAERLTLRCDVKLSRAGASTVKSQVGRILRLDEDFTGWRRVHPVARRKRFDRLFRSATLFEDIVKTMTGCNVTWPNTMRMNALLCERVGGGAFPRPAQLAAMTPSVMKRKCKVGYRAERIIKLARDVESGRLDLAVFEDRSRDTEDVYDALRALHGVGPYAAANLCQLLGRYDRLAIDSETYRHFRQSHGVPTPGDARGLRRLHVCIERHYAPFAPYQFLAYWFELWGDYQTRFGRARDWSAEQDGANFTSNRMKT